MLCSVNFNELQNGSMALQSLNYLLSSCEGNLAKVSSAMKGMRSSSMQTLRSQVRSYEGKVKSLSKGAVRLRSALDTSCAIYAGADKNFDKQNIGDGVAVGQEEENEGFFSRLFNKAKQFVGDAVQWASDTYSALKPYLNMAIGATEFFAGIGMVFTGAGTVAGIAAMVYGWDKFWGGLTDIRDGDAGSGVKPVKAALLDSLSWIGNGIGGETGALIAESLGSILYLSGEILASPDVGKIADGVDDFMDLADDLQDLYKASNGDEGSILKVLADVTFSQTDSSGSDFLDELIPKIVDDFIDSKNPLLVPAH